MIVKVCGMREPENIRAVAALGVDMLGFIFCPGSPRTVPAGFRIPEGLPPTLRKVG
ncbi:MAG: phosphoribosylanthranilate isomerase, partial [Tannerella sp.]|nr:phosphoribosylanthranilate isomerase [Tannerella sp.]